MKIYEVRNLKFSYNNQTKNALVLDDINFDVHCGEFVSILGPNGSGKTTLLKILARLLKLDRGEILIDGKNLEQFERKEFYKIVGYVPQRFNSTFSYSVFEIVLMGRTPYLSRFGFEKLIDIEKTNDVLNKLCINHLKSKSINDISGGELQRVIIARALVQEPKVLLLDEPNTHLDLKNQILIFELLREINKTGTTIISVSHDINLSAIFSDRLIFLKEGKIFIDGKPKDILNENVLKSVFEVSSSIVWSSDKLPQIILNPKVNL